MNIVSNLIGMDEMSFHVTHAPETPKFKTLKHPLETLISEKTAEILIYDLD